MQRDTSPRRSPGSRTRPPRRPARRGPFAAISAVAALGLVGVAAGGVGPAGAQDDHDHSVNPVFIQSNPPVRLFDTRDPGHGTGAEPLQAGTTLVLPVAGQHGVAADATAVQLNVTVLDGTEPSYLTIWDEGERPYVSTINWTPGPDARANAATIGIGGDGAIRVENFTGDVHVVLDVTGHFVDHDHDGRYATVEQVQAVVGSVVDDVEDLVDQHGGVPGPEGPAGPQGPQGPPGPAGADAELELHATAGGDGLLGLPVTVLDTTDWTTVGTFTAPADGDYLLQANVGISFVGSPLLSVAAASTTTCRWSNNTDFEIGASLVAGLTALIVDLPGLDTSNIGLPGQAVDVQAGDEVHLECQVDEVLTLLAQTEVNAAFTAIQVTSLS